MTDFLNNLFSFPTLFFTGLLSLTLLYWMSSIFGFVDLDLGDGAAEGIGSENLELESSETSGGSGWLSKLKLDGIPLTISISLVIFFSWVISFLAVNYYQNKIDETWIELMLGFWVIIIAPFVSAPIVGTLLTPLKPLFAKLKDGAEGRKAGSLVGEIVTIRTNKVTLDFGDADIDIEGANLILKVRAEEPNTLKRGDRAYINNYNTEMNTYTVQQG